MPGQFSTRDVAFPLHGAEITLLSPGPSELESLRQHWDEVVNEAQLTRGDWRSKLDEPELEERDGPPKGNLDRGLDESPANGSSIAFMLAYSGRNLLLTGDAWASVMERSLQRFNDEAGSVQPVDAFKLAHHGSSRNITEGLVKLAHADRYPVSTNGARFRHPDREALQLILDCHDGPPPELVFNYRSEFTEPWGDPSMQSSYGYNAKYLGASPSVLLDDPMPE